MARVFDMDFENVRIVSRDFGGETFGPDQRQFKVVIEDPEFIQKLIDDGVKIWCPEKQSPDDPPVGYMTVKVSYRFGAPKIALLTPEGNAMNFIRCHLYTHLRWMKTGLRMALDFAGHTWMRTILQTFITKKDSLVQCSK